MSDAAREAGGALGQYAYGSSRSATDVIRDILGNLQEIVRSEVRLAKTETREELNKASRAVQLLAAGAILGLFALGMILAAVTLILATTMPAWMAAGITGVTTAIIAAACAFAGRARWRLVHAKPEKTIESVKENVGWMKGQTRS